MKPYKYYVENNKRYVDEWKKITIENIEKAIENALLDGQTSVVCVVNYCYSHAERFGIIDELKNLGYDVKSYDFDKVVIDLTEVWVAYSNK